jgi:hypothetical protein
MIIYSYKYYNKYNQIIKHYKDLDLKKSNEFYTESHHIIPKSIGGTNKKDNLVRVPARVHFLLHWMLYRIYKTVKMGNAWFMMSATLGEDRYNSKSFSYARNTKARIMSERHVSVETRAKMSASKKGTSINKGRIFSDETKAKMANAKRGSKGNNTGKTHSDATKKRLAEINNNMPIVQCPHCSKAGKGNAMKQYHFDMCKMKL